MSSLAFLLPFFAPKEPVGDNYEFDLTLDRTFSGDTPAYGGGNVDPLTFEHDGNNWELWQVIPFVGASVGTVGECRIQLRNRSENRGQNTIDEMPDRITITSSSFNNTPWEFTRPTANNDFFNVGGGQNARKGINYIPVRTPEANIAAAGIAVCNPANAPCESFKFTLHWD